MNQTWMEGLSARIKARSDYNKSGNTWTLFLLPQELEETARRLWEAEFFLEDIAGMDSTEGVVAVYHFDRFSRPGRVALYVAVPHERPEIPSISPIYDGALWHEQECHDFFGIRFTGHPDLSPLLVPEDLGGYPLLKGQEVRSSLKELLVAGDMVERNPGFVPFLNGSSQEAGRSKAVAGSEDSTKSKVDLES